MRLIDGDALYKRIESTGIKPVPMWIRAEFINAPTINAVPREKYDRMKENAEILSKACNEKEYVVRCKDCKHRDPEDKKCDCGHDIQWQLPRSDEWFCADGERGDSDDE